MLLTIAALIAIPVVKRKSVAEVSHDPWRRDFIGLAVICLCYYVAWGFGLPAMLTLGSGAMRVLFQVIYILASSLLGVFLLLFFVLLSKEIRARWKELGQCLCKRGPIGVFEVHENIMAIEEADKENINSESPGGKSVPLTGQVAILEMEEMTSSSKQAGVCFSFSNPITDESEFKMSDFANVVEYADSGERICNEEVGDSVSGGDGGEDLSGGNGSEGASGRGGVDEKVYLDFPTDFEVEDKSTF